MLAEAINFITSYLTSPRRHAAEINSSVRLWARARRCARDWAAHEENCKAFILDAVAALPRKRVAVVLGSGLLRDVPIEKLARSFSEIRLYDLQHLASVRAWAAVKGLRNLHFIWRDLSGVEAFRQKPGAPPDPLAFLEDIEGLDFLVSANLLSQIGVGLGRIAERDKRLPAHAIPDFLKAHVDGLAKLSASAALLTDVDYEIIDRSGVGIERDDLMHGTLLPIPHAEWRWTVAPYGELDPTYKAVHKVLAIRLPPAGPAPAPP